MKKLILCALLLSFTSLVRAEDKAKQDSPCKKVMDACKTAESAKGDRKMKSFLFKDCMKPLLAGESVPGVTVDPQVVAACKARKESKAKTK